MKAALKRFTKARLRAASQLLPFGQDLSLLVAARRGAGLSYRGVFDSYEAAAAKATTDPAYDVLNTQKADSVEAERASLDRWFHLADYAPLYWLGQCLGAGSTVWELGGSVGHFFYSLQRRLDLPLGIEWTIAELPEAVALGRRLAEERGESRLTFVQSAGARPTGDVVLTAGTLQYMPDTFADLIASAPSRPKHIIVHRLPTHDRPAFWTLQNLGLCEVPYRIHNAAQFCESVTALGYALHDSWQESRQLEIPFHRRTHTVTEYSGYAFRLSES